MGKYSLMKDEAAVLLGKIYQKGRRVVIHEYTVCTVLAEGDQTALFIHTFEVLQMNNAACTICLLCGCLNKNSSSGLTYLLG